jgi:hypothetical protein
MRRLPLHLLVLSLLPACPDARHPRYTIINSDDPDVRYEPSDAWQQSQQHSAHGPRVGIALAYPGRDPRSGRNAPHVLYQLDSSEPRTSRTRNSSSEGDSARRKRRTSASDDQRRWWFGLIPTFSLSRLSSSLRPESSTPISGKEALPPELAFSEYLDKSSSLSVDAEYPVGLLPLNQRPVTVTFRFTGE